MTTELKTWDAFENEMSYIWRNAREYNEDGSEISNLSYELEVISTSMCTFGGTNGSPGTL